MKKLVKATGKDKKNSTLIVPVRKHATDLIIGVEDEWKALVARDRLVFDGYKLYWQGAQSSIYSAFSGPADESERESKKDTGPTPQGLFTVNPANVEELEPTDDWGKYRVILEPLRSTVTRMASCFPAIRTQMYIHGGSAVGTHGCIELNNDDEEAKFFGRLKTYGRPLELEVKYVGEREQKYEESQCPY